jgi:hypothetical protein
MLDHGSPAGSASISLVCSNCGYGITIKRDPPACPMCQATAWEPGRWRPFTSLEDVTIARARSARVESERPSRIADEDLLGEVVAELALEPGLEARK